jgi:hypothetical protein
MADYFYAVDLSRNEELALTNSSSSWFAKTTAPRITMSLTASIQHLKLRSMPQNSVTAWREQKTSVTSEQIDMAAGFQRISGKPDIRHGVDAAFGTCDVFETHVSRRTSDAQNR